MNYFAHGRAFVERPYFLAGTAVPDWLSVVDRRMRVRARNVREFLRAEDPQVADVAAGVLQHLDDDGWFHQTRAFSELSLGLTLQIRELLQEERGFRPSFLGHILVEILLDAALIEADPARLDAYYAGLEAADPERVAAAVHQMASHTSPWLATFISRFCRERFLYDYLDDGKLWGRLNMVMRRVQLAPLPAGLLDLLPAARQEIRRRRTELLGQCPPDELEGERP
jgi:hypothetical protein